MKWNELTEIFSGYKLAYKNYIFVLLKMYTQRKFVGRKNVTIKIKLKDGKKLVVPFGWAKYYSEINSLQSKIKNKNISDIKLSDKGISFNYNGHPLIMDMPKFSDPYAVFLKEEYKYLEVRGKDVIDIGVNIGDSLIYFAIKGAKRVIGLEPYPYAFSFAERNVKLNEIHNIILLNCGYGKDDDVIVSESLTSPGSSLVNSSIGRKIKVISLRTIINTYDLKTIILKMDCEGCEYALMDEDDEIFDKIEMIQLEYHYGYERIVDKLKNLGFNVTFTLPKNSYNAYATNPYMNIGYIYAIQNK